jgi:16S rRNA (guanine1207-N2)-methyltransferase
LDTTSKKTESYAHESYYTPKPTIPSRPQEVTYSFDDKKVSLKTDRGTFSYSKVDAGSQVLLKVAPDPEIPGDIIDVGCGYGAITVALAMRYPDRTIWAVDVNERSLGLVRANAKNLGLKNIVIARPDDVIDKKFAAIYSNPPIRIGKEELHSLLTKWLSTLKDDGKAYLVVKKNLGADSLALWIESIGYETTRLSSKKGYRVLECKKNV